MTSFSDLEDCGIKRNVQDGDHVTTFILVDLILLYFLVLDFCLFVCFTFL